MKYLLIASSMALGLGLQPVQAEEQSASKPQAAHQQETLHAPTNRVGEMVPTMTAPGNKDDASMPQDAGGEHKAETMHPPTNRVGDQVPTMKSAENKDDQTESKTYYRGNDSNSSN